MCQNILLLPLIPIFLSVSQLKLCLSYCKNIQTEKGNSDKLNLVCKGATNHYETIFIFCWRTVSDKYMSVLERQTDYYFHRTYLHWRLLKLLTCLLLVQLLRVVEMADSVRPCSWRSQTRRWQEQPKTVPGPLE